MKLEEIRALCEAATPGPWYYPADGRESVKTSSGGNVVYPVTIGDHETQLANCAFIAAARTLMPLLLNVAEAARSMLAEIKYEPATQIELRAAEALLALEAAYVD